MIAIFVVPHFVHSVAPTPRHCLNNLAVIAKETGRTGELVRAARGVFYQLAGETETPLSSSFWSNLFC